MNGKAITEQAAQLALQHVLQRIAAAASAAGRAADSVRLLAVSKTFSAPNLLAMASCGQRAFGENYLQEALDKQRIIADQRPDLHLEWHFIGPIQSNKTRPIAENFDWVHTVDREKIAVRLSEQRPDQSPPLNVCLQVNIDQSPSKSGCLPDQALELARIIASQPRLRLRGLMAIPDPSDDPAVQQGAFAAVRELFEQIQQHIGTPENYDLDTLSIGMTADLEAAIAQGATIVRVGTALFGARTKRP